jgi:NADH-quinone oxidoreductase subunit L
MFKPRDHEIHAHESPKVMTMPLVVLAVLSIVSGWIGWPTKNLFHHFVHFGEGEAIPFSWTVALLATGAAALGILMGWAIFCKRVVSPSIFRAKLPWAYNLLANKYYLDEIYWAILVKPLFWISTTFSRFDHSIVDGFVNGVASITMGLSMVHAWIDKWIIDGFVNLVGGITKLWGRLLRFTQTGMAQDYVLVIFVGLVMIVGVCLMKW